MSVSEELRNKFDDGVIHSVRTGKSSLHGEGIEFVEAVLNNGRIVVGNFTKEEKPGFGGVDFSARKDVVGLMTAKIRSVLRGTAE